jgi:Na+/H+ antiporter NhaD/arsenite permease-like protein
LIREEAVTWRTAILAMVGLLAQPSCVWAADAEPLDPPLWTGAPFVLLLLAIAVLPLVAGHFWRRNRNKALVAGLLALPVVLYLINAGPGPRAPNSPPVAETPGKNGAATHDSFLTRAGTQALIHGLGEYAAFIVLLAALYTISGGIVLRGDLQARPMTNVGFLAFGAVLGNLIGTTGASMLLIRPLLQTNRQRRNTCHLVVFFIFVVSNFGGLLIPLGPPLFLGFLDGVDFLWTVTLWRQFLLVNGIVLVIFLIWDTVAYRRESAEAIGRDVSQIEPLRVHGLVNLVFLAGVLVAVVFQSEQLSGLCSAWVSRFFPCPSLLLSRTLSELLMVAMGLGSWWLTPRQLRTANAFGWGAITEVAILFAGIFVTMTPALAWVSLHGPTLGITEPRQYFWICGGLSSFLDNAPTYLIFGTLAGGSGGIGGLMVSKPLVLQAISCGAVFMGANTYIGNGPNFMVKAIADEAGFKTPSFFGYLAYSGLILLPVFLLVTLLFF